MKLESVVYNYDVMTYSEHESVRFKNYMKNNMGFETKTTYFSDFAIVDYFFAKSGSKPILDTYDRAIKFCGVDIEYMIELVFILNKRCWDWYYDKEIELSEIYSDLYRKAVDYVYEKFADDKEALFRFYSMTD